MYRHVGKTDQVPHRKRVPGCIVMSAKLTKYLTENGYLDGRVPGWTSTWMDEYLDVSVNKGSRECLAV
ncbi:hypothetical protein ACOMHN_026299 [Nucella lapillus]